LRCPHAISSIHFGRLQHRNFPASNPGHAEVLQTMSFGKRLIDARQHRIWKHVMRRRGFLSLFSGAANGAPPAVSLASPNKRPPRIGDRLGESRTPGKSAGDAIE
jgi:hypothetical protein